MSGFFGQELLSEIRSANDIVDVIQWLNVPLKKAGGSFRALCPFHKEKTPSFHVNPERQSFHCFGCGAGGDVFKFIMMREGLEFPAAVERLAERARIPLPVHREGSTGPSRDHRDRLYDLHVQVRDWFHTNLMRSRHAESARAYLKQRGFDAEVAKTFKLGYAPSAWDGLVEWANAAEIPVSLLEEAGLVVKGSRGFYDRFRDRLMIPIADEMGRVSGFSGRLLLKDVKEAKYVNSPETTIFKKGRLLFGLDRSKRDIQERGFAIVCEGQLDWIRCFTSDVRNVIAPQGTAFTDEQARILKRYVDQVVLCFDSDTAGQKATWKNAETLIANSVAVKACRLPEGEDPDSFIRKSGAKEFRQRLDEALDVFEYKALALKKSLNMKDPRSHQKIVVELTPMLALVESEPQQQQVIQNICEIVQMDSQAFLNEFRRQNKRGRMVVRDEPSRDPPGKLEDSIMGFGDYLLRLALTEEPAAKMLAKHLKEEWFSGYGLRRVLFYVIAKAQEGKWQGGWNGLGLDLDDADKDRIAKLLTVSMPMTKRDMAMGLQQAVAGAHRAFLNGEIQERLRLLQNPDLKDHDRRQCQTELLDLDRQIKQV